MERIRDLPANGETVEHLLHLAMATPAHRLVPRLREHARERLDAGYPNDQLYVDLVRVSGELSERGEEEREDAVLDVMDFLTGWCAPAARLY